VLGSRGQKDERRKHAREVLELASEVQLMEVACEAIKLMRCNGAGERHDGTHEEDDETGNR